MNNLGEYENANMADMLEATGIAGVNEVLPDGDYETQISADGDWSNAFGKKKKKLTPEEQKKADEAKSAKKKARGEKFDKFLEKGANVADKVGKGAAIVKGASDAYKKSKAPAQEESYEEFPSENPNKKLFIIGGVVVALGVIGFVAFKFLGKKK